MAFAWNGENGDNFDIYVKLVSGGEPLKLTSNPAPDVSPTWSPDGGDIAFCRELPNTIEIWTIPALGGAERKLGESERCQGMSWSPDGRFLAIVDQSTSQEPWHISFLSVSTGEKQQVTSPSREHLGDFAPQFSPDGKTLAFGRAPEIRTSDIYVQPVASRRPMATPRRLTLGQGRIMNLDWTADGKRIVYSMGEEGTSSLWIIASSGGMPQRLSVAGENPAALSVSRTGERLVYEHRMFDSNIWQISGPKLADKKSAPSRFIASTQADMEPQFSPDGRKIVFSSARSGDFELWVCERDGGKPIQLTSLGGTDAGSPRWSPDSRWIAFDSIKAGNSDIYVISVDGAQPRRFTAGPANNVRPSWSRDGRSIYFGSNRSGAWQIWKQPTQGTMAVQVTKTKGAEEAFESPDGKFLYFAKLYAPGIWRMPVAGGEETLVFDRAEGSLWALTDQGICFFDFNGPAGPALKFHNFSTGKEILLWEFAKDTIIDSNSTALSVSPDGRWILYTQNEQPSIDLMLVENFR